SRSDYPYMIERDPMAPATDLPPHAPQAERPMQAAAGPRAQAPRLFQDARNPSHASGAPARPLPGKFESARDLTRTALCVEVRDPHRANGPKAENTHGGKGGLLYVFMPPLAE